MNKKTFQAICATKLPSGTVYEQLEKTVKSAHSNTGSAVVMVHDLNTTTGDKRLEVLHQLHNNLRHQLIYLAQACEVCGWSIDDFVVELILAENNKPLSDLAKKALYGEG